MKPYGVYSIYHSHLSIKIETFIFAITIWVWNSITTPFTITIRASKPFDNHSVCNNHLSIQTLQGLYVQHKLLLRTFCLESQASRKGCGFIVFLEKCLATPCYNHFKDTFLMKDHNSCLYGKIHKKILEIIINKISILIWSIVP